MLCIGVHVSEDSFSQPSQSRRSRMLVSLGPSQYHVCDTGCVVILAAWCGHILGDVGADLM